MQLTNIFQVALFVAFQASAAPVAESEAFTPLATNALFKRAECHPVSCGPPSNQRAWTKEAVQGAFDALSSNGNKADPDKPGAGDRKYPRQFGQGSRPPRDPNVVAALDAIPECSTSLAGSWKWYEYPLTDPVFDGGAAGDQGPDRVIAISENVGQGGVRSYTYCLAITHRGTEVDGAFDPCTNAV